MHLRTMQDASARPTADEAVANAQKDLLAQADSERRPAIRN
jgi:hypothetical protein